jgi:hypothetical protein
MRFFSEEQAVEKEMGSSTVTNSLRNGILFVIIVLCIHFAARTIAEDRNAEARSRQFANSGGQTAAAGSVSASEIAAKAQRPPSNLSPAETQLATPVAPTASHGASLSADPEMDPELYNYVFGSSPPAPPSAPPPTAVVAQQQSRKIKKALSSSQSPPIPAPAAAFPEAVEPDGLTDGFMVIGRYEDEDVMCGGKLLGGLEGYNTGSSVYAL